MAQKRTFKHFGGTPGGYIANSCISTIKDEIKTQQEEKPTKLNH